MDALEQVTKERDLWRDRFAAREFESALGEAVRAAGGRPDAVDDFEARARKAGWHYDPESGTVKPGKDAPIPSRMPLREWVAGLRPEAGHLFPQERDARPATCTKEQARNPSPELLRAIAAGTVIVTG